MTRTISAAVDPGETVILDDGTQFWVGSDGVRGVFIRITGDVSIELGMSKADANRVASALQMAAVDRRGATYKPDITR